MSNSLINYANNYAALWLPICAIHNCTSMLNSFKTGTRIKSLLVYSRYDKTEICSLLEFCNKQPGAMPGGQNKPLLL